MTFLLLLLVCPLASELAFIIILIVEPSKKRRYRVCYVMLSTYIVSHTWHSTSFGGVRLECFILLT